MCGLLLGLLNHCSSVTERRLPRCDKNPRKKLLKHPTRPSCDNMDASLHKKNITDRKNEKRLKRSNAELVVGSVSKSLLTLRMRGNSGLSVSERTGTLNSESVAMVT